LFFGGKNSIFVSKFFSANEPKKKFIFFFKFFSVSIKQNKTKQNKTKR
jgi:hypothetical protein